MPFKSAWYPLLFSLSFNSPWILIFSIDCRSDMLCIQTYTHLVLPVRAVQIISVAPTVPETKITEEQAVTFTWFRHIDLHLFLLESIIQATLSQCADCIFFHILLQILDVNVPWSFCCYIYYSHKDTIDHSKQQHTGWDLFTQSRRTAGISNLRRIFFLPIFQKHADLNLI